MTISLVAILVYAASLFFQWRRGNISVEGPPRGGADERVNDLDLGSSTVWDVANVLEAVGLLAGLSGLAKIDANSPLLASAGLGLLVVGLALRWTAIRALGRFFIGTVSIQPNHRLVRQGMYRRVRHPAYAGTLIAHFGLGLAIVSWVSVALSTIPFVIAAVYRMRVEEAALRRQFGGEYLAYEAATWRLLPWLY